MIEQPIPSVRLAAHQFSSSIVKIQYDDPRLDTTLQLHGGQVVGLQSAVAPKWSTLLASVGVSPAAIAQAHAEGGHIRGILKALLDRAVLTPDQLDGLVQQRAVTALMPLALHREGRAQVQRISAPVGAFGTDVEGAVQFAERHTARLPFAARALRPTDTLYAQPTAALTGDGMSARVYKEALHGMTLGDMAQRLAVRWDLLMLTVTDLEQKGILSRMRLGHQVRPPVTIGQAAPDFTLPRLQGGNLTLSRLQGQKVWLIMNRQATCMLCNPHNAAIITLHARLQAAGVQIVTIWGSELADLQQGIGELRPPYPVLSDPHDQVYDAYGLRRSLSGAVLDLRNLKTIRQGFGMVGLKGLKADGELTRLPAEFLIDSDGRVAHAHYNTFGADWLPFERVLSWAGVEA